ncbi:MAG: hypothetical protein U9Q92_01025 [archaeon]|nr:hypothetical protein [archaeon]
MIKRQQKKAQINIFTQPIMLIILISIFALFVIKTLQVNVSISQEAEEYNFKSKAGPMFERVLKCISDDSTRYPYLVSASKLEKLNSDFINHEPPCMRDGKLGWDATVKDIDSRTGKTWRFGESESSEGKALKYEYGITMPVAIKYEDGIVNPGELNLNIRQGDLESIVGRVETVYKIGSETKKDITTTITVRLDYPVLLKEKEGKKSICLKADENDFCKTLSFSNIKFKPIDTGMHYLILKYDHKKKKISVSD